MGTDTNGESQASEGIVLYQSSIKVGSCPDVARALRRVDKKLLCFLQITLAADTKTHIRFERGCAYYPIMRTLVTPIYPSLAALVDDVSDISSWMATWASSTQRQPELTPDWARRRQIDSPYVSMIANVIRGSLAGSRAVSLQIESTCGRSGLLHIPASAQINPLRDRHERLSCLPVEHVTPHRLAMTPTGTYVHIPADDLSDVLQTNDEIEIHSKKTHRIAANIARARNIRRLSGDPEGEITP